MLNRGSPIVSFTAKQPVPRRSQIESPFSLEKIILAPLIDEIESNLAKFGRFQRFVNPKASW